uniref:Uncharacterized protein n=1 Tax=Nelumbo nucifera TaxID=4432 RepID=A0A822ZSF2_NELNU|nr:TPA_asm: hypothetical protein HUJ06_017367 [Nelumbo nucifera]
MLEDVYPMCFEDNNQGNNLEISLEEPCGDVETFLQFIEDAKEPLWSGNKHFTVMTFIVTILHLKSLYGVRWRKLMYVHMIVCFWGDNEGKDKCDKCGHPRWKSGNYSEVDDL